MMKKALFALLFAGAIPGLSLAQDSPEPARQRLDFARTYFEGGMAYTPAFQGAMMTNGDLGMATHGAKLHPYLTWGGFHFWGHAEFYVTFPFSSLAIQNGPEHDYWLSHGVVTGARYLPWAYEPGKLRPYVGLSWLGIEFRPRHENPDDAPILTDNFVPAPDAGLLFGMGNWVGRLGVNLLPKNSWEYAVSPTQVETIRTPGWSLQAGIVYTFEESHHKEEAVNDRWNQYPRRSRLAVEDSPPGDWFVGIAPSGSFGLQASEYTQSAFPFLDPRLSSKGFVELAAGYQWNQAGLFTAISFRNPTFATQGYGVSQEVQKTSLSLEVNKILVDFSGFAPFIGLNVAWDRLNYQETTETSQRSLVHQSWEPGLSFGWDIVPGKTDEALILRTSLRWYPFAQFEVDGQPFQFSQLEYNLIQAVFYPERYLRSKGMLKK
ncbi:MAG: hypothetical protein AAFQ98_09030 [Bacteroidota bacterium]